VSILLNLHDKKLDTIIESHPYHLWGDLRRILETEIRTESERYYRTKGWLPPQNDDYSGIRSTVLEAMLTTGWPRLPEALKTTDEDICLLALERAEIGMMKAIRGGTEEFTREMNPAWHRRKLRRKNRLEVAQWQFKSNSVREYSTSYSQALSREQDNRNANILKRRFIFNPDAKDPTEKFTSMYIVAQKGIENGHNELIAISKDMNSLAQERKWNPHFITTTCAGYRRNFTPDVNHAFMQKQWERMRASLSKKGIVAGVDFMGVRCEEPHKEGTPHRHIVILCSNEVWGEIETAFKTYFLDADAPGESGAKKYRVKIDEPQSFDEDLGKAVFYCLKYIYKNTTNLDASQFEESNDTASKCRAWRQDYGVRAFQFFGVGNRTLYRQIRSKYSDKNHSFDIVKAALNGDWHGFINEYYKLGKKNIKAISIQAINAYGESIKKITGYAFNGSTIVEKTRQAIIKHQKHVVSPALVTVTSTEPRVGQNLKTQTAFDKFQHPPPDLLTV